MSYVIPIEDTRLAGAAVRLTLIARLRNRNAVDISPWRRDEILAR